MDTIYLIYMNLGDYDSFPSVIGYTLTEEDANKIVEEETKNYKAAQILNDEIQVRRKEFKDSLPELIYETKPSFPKWAKGLSEKNITLEMRKERDKINEQHRIISEINSLKFNERKELIHNFLKQNICKNIPTELKYFFDDTFYIKYFLDFKQAYFFEAISKINLTT